MKQPMFLYKGKTYPVTLISFTGEDLSSIAFRKGYEHVLAFQKNFDFESETIKDGMVHLNLKEHLILQTEEVE